MNKIYIGLACLFSVLFAGSALAQEKALQLNYREYYTPENEQYRILLTWNSKTGKASRFYYDEESWKKSTAAIPTNLAGSEPTEAGELMINYWEYYTPQGEQYRIIFAWNTKTGKAQRYYYDEESWKKSTVAFPDAPVESSGKVGEIMMSYNEYFTPDGEQYRIVLVWNTKTGTAQRYYYDEESWKKSTVAFPAAPVESTGAIGEVMMTYREYFTPEREQYRIVFVWNTKNGKGQRYYYDEESWKKSTVSFPENPVGETSTAAGEVLMNYTEYYTPEGEQYRIIFAWNTKTGKAARYYYDEESWKKSTISFPETPVETSGAIGEVMMVYREYFTPDAEQYRIVIAWNTKTGKSARYYYDAESWHKSTVEMPANLVE